MPPSPYNVALIGYGYWGPVLLRNFAASNRFRVKYVCDRHLEKARAAQKLVPECQFIVDATIAFEDPSIDVIAIATEATTHEALAQQALHHRKHLFIEKPFTLNLSAAEELCRRAHAQQRIIWIDHTFLFNPAFAVLKRELANGKIGQIKNFTSVRTMPGPASRDANVVWNLAYHDAYLLLELLPSFPTKSQSTISANGMAAEIALTYADDLTAHVTVDMEHSTKQRAITITGTTGSFLWDETSTEKLIYQSKGASPVPLSVASDEALALEVAAFARHLDGNTEAPSDGIKALQAMRLTTMMATP